VGTLRDSETEICFIQNKEVHLPQILKKVRYMKRNISALDKNIRLLIIVVIAILGLYNEFSVTVASVLGAISILLLVTIMIGFSPIYMLLGISTYKEKNK